jgi:hypothetical protein
VAQKNDERDGRDDGAVSFCPLRQQLSAVTEMMAIALFGVNMMLTLTTGSPLDLWPSNASAMSE